MANIIAKAFDATKKIAKTIFKGSPNLFTADDLNLQLAVIKEQLDWLERKAIPYVDGQAEAGATLSGTKAGFTVQFYDSTCFLYAYGSKVDIEEIDYKMGLNGKYTTDIDSNDVGKELYLVVTADSAITNDKTITGANFSDGTTIDAAEHYVYTNFKIQCMHLSEMTAAISSKPYLVVLAKVSVIATNVLGNVVNLFNNVNSTPNDFTRTTSLSASGTCYAAPDFDPTAGLYGTNVGAWCGYRNCNLAFFQVKLTNVSELTGGSKDLYLDSAAQKLGINKIENGTTLAMYFNRSSFKGTPMMVSGSSTEAATVAPQELFLGPMIYCYNDKGIKSIRLMTTDLEFTLTPNDLVINFILACS